MSNYYNKCCSQKKVLVNKNCSKTGIKFSSQTPVSSCLAFTDSIILPIEGNCNVAQHIVRKATTVCSALVKVETDAGDNFFALDSNNNLLSFDIPECANNLYYDYEPKYNDRIAVRHIVGIDPGQTAIGIDFRPTDGKLYLLTNCPGGARLYVLNTSDPCNVIADPVGNYLSSISGGTILLDGTEFSIDFNPVSGLLQVVSNTGQNLIVNPLSGLTSVLGPLTYAAGDINFQRAVVIGGIAFTNSVVNAPTTALYVIDTAQNVLAVNNQLSSNLNTVGPIGFDVTQVLGFAIQPGTNIGFAVLTATNGLTGIYIVDLQTGFARLVQCLDTNNQALRSLAILPSAIGSSFNITLLNNGIGTAISARITITSRGVNCFAIDNRANLDKCDVISVVVTATSAAGIPSGVNISLELC